MVSLTRDVLNSKFSIESWFNIEEQLSTLLKSSQSKDELIAYFRFLAVKAKFDYFVGKTQFNNAKGYFKRIVDILYTQKDYLILGYFVYFTQYFSCKKEREIEKSSNPFEDDDDYDNFFEADPEEKENEGQDSAVKGDKDTSLNLFNDSVVSHTSITEEEVNNFVKRKKYFMMVDNYYIHQFSKDKEFWKFMMTQLFKVKLKNFKLLKSYKKRMPKKTDYQIFKNLLIRNLCLMKRCYGVESEVPQQVFLEISSEFNVLLNEKTRVRRILLNILESICDFCE